MKMPATGKFAILTMSRTGSNLMSTLLASHPRIFVHGEIFDPRKVFGPPDLSELLAPIVTKYGNLTALREKDPLSFLELMIQPVASRDIVGYKQFLNQFPEILQHVLADVNYRII